MYEHEDHNVENLMEVTQLDLGNTHTHTQSMQNSRREKSDNKDSKDLSNLNSNLLKNTVRLYSNFPETRGFNLKR